MSETFDAYHQWLGIPPAEQPPNLYRLLGIQLFEQDANVVDAAANQRLRHLRTYQTGKNSSISQKLLNEVSAARICLLAPEKRTAYDQKLRESLNPFKPLAESVQPVKKQKPAWVIPATVGGGVLAVVVVVMVVAFGSAGQETSSPQPSDEQAKTTPTEPTQQPQPAIETTPTKPASENDTFSEPPNTDGQTATAIGTSDTVGAVLEVSRMKMTSLAFPHRLPQSPASAFTFEWVTEPKGADINNGVVQFEVKRDGLVYLMTSTQYQGNKSGGWWEERVTKDQLVKQGWQDLGPCPWNSKESLLKRVVKVGESYRIRMNKYGPPKLIVPGPWRATLPQSPRRLCQS